MSNRNHRDAMPAATPGNNLTGGRIRQDLADKLLDPESYQGAKFGRNNNGDLEARVNIGPYNVIATNTGDGIMFDISHAAQYAHTKHVVASPIEDFKGVDVPTNGAILEVSPSAKETKTLLKAYPTTGAMKQGMDQRRIPLLQEPKVDFKQAQGVMDLIKEKATPPANKKSIAPKKLGMEI